LDKENIMAKALTATPPAVIPTTSAIPTKLSIGKTIGKATKYDIVKEQVYVEVDKSQVVTLDAIDYVLILCDIGGAIGTSIISLSKADSKQFFVIDDVDKDTSRLLIGKNITILLKKHGVVEYNNIYRYY
jgi:hypothetical protein